MSVPSAQAYTGTDNLEVMATARNYLAYLNDSIAAVAGSPSDGLRLLDFGAGAGTHAADMRERSFNVACVEVDGQLLQRLRSQGFDAQADVTDFEPASFDLAYTMNVLEHIEDDLGVLRRIHSRVREGGKLVVYVPALNILYSSMDRKVGHVRRYRRQPLVELVRSAGFTVDSCRYVDSIGYFTTLAYKVVGSREGDISPATVGFYDRYLFPLSRRLDRVTAKRFGKNLLLVAHRPAERH